jgi:hypothetical protein
MTMLECLNRSRILNEMEWHRRNAGSLMKVRHLWPHVVSEIRNHLIHARYYKTLLKCL